MDAIVVPGKDKNKMIPITNDESKKRWHNHHKLEAKKKKRQKNNTIIFKIFNLTAHFRSRISKARIRHRLPSSAMAPSQLIGARLKSWLWI